MLRRDFVKLPALAVLPVSLPEIPNNEEVKVLAVNPYITNPLTPINERIARTNWNRLIDVALETNQPNRYWMARVVGEESADVKLPNGERKRYLNIFCIQIVETRHIIIYHRNFRLARLECIGYKCLLERGLL